MKFMETDCKNTINFHKFPLVSINFHFIFGFLFKLMLKQNYQDICSNVLAVLPPKQEKIITRRFGLESGERETLERIGRDFGITRERVRQIETNGLQKLEEVKKEKEVQKVFNFLGRYLNKQGGLKREDILLSDLTGNRPQEQNLVYFFLVLGDPFHYFRENENFYSFWTTEKILFKKAEQILNNLLSIFEKENRPLTMEEFFKLGKKEDSKVFFSCFEIFKSIEEGPLNNVGLVEWTEIKPRRVGDRAYLIFKKANQPLHFTKVAELVNELEGPVCPARKTLTQTIHNELIQDERFVLIGKGTYALKEWGYKPGIIRDIIVDILRDAGRPLTKEEIVEKILSQRYVKKNTVLINLQNKNFFTKNKEGRYTL